MRKKLLAIAFGGVFALSVAVPAFAVHNANHPAKVDICHNGNTISVSAQGAANHLANHATDTAGVCP